ncbi:MAG: S-layer homology domain-containing protein [Clostridia bacterium]|nr:S-layer homology domain-containing protein [Clostridia bacterium]
MKKWLSILLAVTFILSMVQLPAMAAGSADILDVSVEGGTVIPSFRSDVYNYWVGISPNASIPDVVYELANGNADVTVEKASDFNETTTITVVNGGEPKVYSFKFVAKHEKQGMETSYILDSATLNDGVNNAMGYMEFVTAASNDQASKYSRIGFNGMNTRDQHYFTILRFDFRGLDYNIFEDFQLTVYEHTANAEGTGYISVFAAYEAPYNDSWQGWKGWEYFKEQYQPGDIQPNAWYTNLVDTGRLIFDKTYQAPVAPSAAASNIVLDVTEPVRNMLVNGREQFTLAVYMPKSENQHFVTNFIARLQPTTSNTYISYATNTKDTDAKLKDVSVTNGALDKLFNPDETSYKIGVEEGEVPEISYVRSSGHSTVEYIPAEGIGDTAILRVTAEDSKVRPIEYTFELVSLEDAGITENGKLTAGEFKYSNKKLNASETLEISAILANNNTSEKNATIVSTVKKDNELTFAKITTEAIGSGVKKIYDSVETPANISDAKVEAYLFDTDAEKLLTDKISLSNITDDKTLVDSAKEITYDILDDDGNVKFYGKAKANASYPFFVTKPGTDYADLAEGDMTDILAAFDVVKTNANGIWKSDVKIDTNNDTAYKAYIVLDDEIKSVDCLYADTDAKNASASEILDILNSDLDEDAKIESVIDSISYDVLGLDSSVYSYLSEEDVIESFYDIITEEDLDDADYEDIILAFEKAVLVNTLNEGAELSAGYIIEKFGFSELEDLYSKLTNQRKAKFDASLINKDVTFSKLPELIKTNIILDLISYPENVSVSKNVIEDFGEDIGLDIEEYEDLKNKSTFVQKLVDQGPYQTVSALKTKFDKLIKDANKPQGGGGGIVVSGNDGFLGAIVGGKGSSSDYYVDVIVEQSKVQVFGDVAKDSWTYEPTKYLNEKGILTGTGNGNFEPARSVTRGEFVKILCLAFNLELTDEEITFSDVNDSMWYSQYVKAAVKAGAVNGKGDGTFGGNDSLTREDIAVIIARVLNADVAETEAFGDDAEISDYAKDAVYTLKDMGVLSGTGNGNFEPKRAVTRGECAKIVYELIK